MLSYIIINSVAIIIVIGALAYQYYLFFDTKNKIEQAIAQDTADLSIVNANLITTQTGIKNDINTINTTSSTLRNDINTINTSSSTLRNDINTLNTASSTLKNDISDTMNELKNNIDTTNLSFRNDITNAQTALVDGLTDVKAAIDTEHKFSKDINDATQQYLNEVDTLGYNTSLLNDATQKQLDTLSNQFNTFNDATQQQLVAIVNKLKSTTSDDATQQQRLTALDNQFKSLTEQVITKNIKSNKYQIGDKWTLSGVGDPKGNDDYLRVMGRDGTDYYGGVAMNKLLTNTNATLKGTVDVTGADMILKGGTSEHNPSRLGTFFSNSSDSKNYIRGDTELRGNTNNIGDISVGRNMNVTGTIKGKSVCVEDVCMTKAQLQKMITQAGA